MPLVVEIKVVPASGRTGCILESTGRIKCYLKSPPEKGKANHEIISFLAKALKVGKHCIEIITGHTSRIKRVRIDTEHTLEELHAALGFEQQLLIT